MKKFGLILVLCFSIQTSLYGQEVFAAKDPAAVKIDAYFAALAKREMFNGSVLIALGDKILLKRTYNIASKVPGLRTSIDRQSMIASVGKLFVKFAFLKLVEQKKIALDDKLSKFIPDFPSGDRIAIRNLVNHTSGLPRELTGRETLSGVNLEKIVELARKGAASV